MAVARLRHSERAATSSARVTSSTRASPLIRTQVRSGHRTFQEGRGTRPRLHNAKLYLAAAYVAQYIPGVDSPTISQNANEAIEQYKAVPTQDPKNVNSMKGIAGLYIADEEIRRRARTYYRKALDLDPNDPEAYYSIGVIDWTMAFHPRMEERAKLGLRPDEPLKDKKVCAKLRADAEADIQDGIDNLKKAFSLRQDYDDAMAYMNLMYREKADRECDEPDQRTADLKTADEWVDKAMAAKKGQGRKSRRQPAGHYPGPIEIAFYVVSS